MLYIYMCFCTITKENHQAPCFQIWTHFQLHNSGLVLSRISQLTSRLQWSVDSWLPPTNPSINTRVFHKLAVKEPWCANTNVAPGRSNSSPYFSAPLIHFTNKWDHFLDSVCDIISTVCIQIHVRTHFFLLPASTSWQLLMWQSSYMKIY